MLSFRVRFREKTVDVQIDGKQSVSDLADVSSLGLS